MLVVGGEMLKNTFVACGMLSLMVFLYKKKKSRDVYISAPYWGLSDRHEFSDRD